MRKLTLVLLAAGMAFGATAQSAIDAYNITPTELRGTARFMSMGGAFTALGGDLSTLSQNPAGVGVYRRSEVGATLDIDIRKFQASTPSQSNFDSQTKVYCNNFGYVGSTQLVGALKSFSWGVSYNRLASFDNVFRGYNLPTNTSLTNYIASYTNGTPQSDLAFAQNYNPYSDSDCDWLSILAYNSFMINPTGGSQYRGLYRDGTRADAEYSVRDRGYVCEYDIDFAGNVDDMVYWGFGVGIYDISYSREVNYSESLENAAVSTETSNYVGNAGFYLDNWKSISGSGANLKFGVIFKPVNELRIGAAIHTPTWLALTHRGQAQTQYSFFNPAEVQSDRNPFKGSEYTDNINYASHLTSPWRFMLGASGVIGSQAIVSVDYERVNYGAMRSAYQVWDSWGGVDYVSDNAVNGDIKQYFKSANIVRAGAELRVTPQFSLRCGFNWQSTNVKPEVSRPDTNVEVFTAGVDPSYRFDGDTYNYSVGMGYRYQSWYIDAAYVHTNRTSTFHAYTNYDGLVAPQAKLQSNLNSIVISTGFRF